MDGEVVIGINADSSEFEKKLYKLEKTLQKKEVEIEINSKEIDATNSDLKSLQAQLNSVDEELGSISGEAQYLAQLKSKLEAEPTKPMFEVLSPDELGDYDFLKNLAQVDTKEKELIAKREQLNTKIEQGNAKLTKQNQKLLEANTAYQETKVKIESLKHDNIVKGINSVEKSIGGVIKKVLKWSLALIGVRSIYMGIRSAMSTLTSEDDELKAKVDYMKWALATAIKPIIEWIINAMYTVLGIIAKIIYAFTGYNIFEQSGIKDYEKAMKSSNKSAKDLKKTLAGFDEMNVINDNGTTGTASGAIPKDSFDLSNVIDYESGVEKTTKKLVNDWFTVGDEMKEALNNPQVFGEAFGEWGMFVEGIVSFFDGVWNAITGFFESIGGVLDMIVGLFTGNFDLIAEGWNFLWDGIWNVLTGILEMIVGIIQAVIGVIVGIIVELWNTIVGIISKIWEGICWLFDNIGKGVEACWKAVCDFISGIAQWIYDNVIKPIWDFIVNLFNKIIEGVKKVWNGIIDIIRKIAGWIYDNIIKPVWDFFVNLFNKIKDGVVNAWNGVTSILGKIGSWIYDNVVRPVGDFFANMWNGFKEGASQAWEGVKNIFSKVAEFFRNIFTNAWEGVKRVFSKGGEIFKGIAEGIFEAFKKVVNAIIDGINTVVRIPFDGINGALQGIKGVDLWGWKPFDWIQLIKVPQIPHLAKGAILNNPGKGVPVAGGSAIAGEAGREAYLPLSDSQLLEELGSSIGKYVTLNATIPVYVGNRQIAREIQKINAENDFAYNR